MYNYISNKKPDFSFFIPIDAEDIKKSGGKNGKYQDLIVSGVASDEVEDSDEEILQPSGFELDRFLKLGWVNYDHRSKDDPKFIIGEPLDAKVINDKFYVKAKLFGENEIARNLYATMLMLKKAGSKRKIGWSIEGRAIERDERNPKIVKKALITGVALTPNPKCTTTFADIVKGRYGKPDYNDIKKSDANGGKVTYLVDITDYEKGIRYMVDTDLKLRVEKAINSVDAKPLIPESLEGKKKKAILNVANAVVNGNVPKSVFDKAVQKINS